VEQRPRRQIRRTSVVLGALVGYVALLHYAYEKLISPSFAYGGYTYRDPVWHLYFYAILLVIFIGLLLPKRVERPSDLVLWLLFTVAVAPSILIAQYADILAPNGAMALSCLITASFIGVILFNRGLVTRAIPTPRLSSTSFWILLTVVTLITYGYMLITIGLHLRLVSLTDVYDVRGDYRADIVAGGATIARLISIQSNVINPVIMVRGIHTRNRLMIAAGVFGQLLIFASTGFRSVLFSIPLLLLIVLSFRRNSRPPGSNILIGTIAIAACAVGVDRVFNTITWTSLIIRRFIVSPGLLSAVYVDVFSRLPSAHLGHSVLRGIVRYPYPEGVTPASVVGSTYFKQPDMSANANIFADGFMNFGYLGVVAAAVVLLVILRAIDGASIGIPTRVAGAILTLPMISLANSGILTTLMTHGLIASIVILAVLPRDGWEARIGEQPGSSARHTSPTRVEEARVDE